MRCGVARGWPGWNSGAGALLCYNALMLLLIDATAYLFRAFHAVGDLRTSGGTPTGGVFGTLKMLEKLRRDFPAQAIACVMDAPGKTHRHALFPQYKATRPPPPPELVSQIAALKAFVQAMGMPLVVVPGVEADDVIATYAGQAVRAETPVLVASGDKDLMQLVRDGAVRLYDGMKEVVYDRAAVTAKYGVPPELMGDFLALTGDSADNVPGVAKVGAKTAAKWLAAYGDLAGVRAAAVAGEVRGVVGECLRAAVEDGSLALSRELVTLKTDVGVPSMAELTPRAPDVCEWRRLCGEFEFKNLADWFEAGVGWGAAAERGRPVVEVVGEVAALERWVARIREAGGVAVDTETVGEPVMAARLVGVSLSVDGSDAAYVPLAHVAEAALPGGAVAVEGQLPVARALAVLAPVLEDADVVKILHNGKYDWHVFANAGVALEGVLHDTKIAAYVHEAGAETTLAALARRFLGEKTSEYKEVTAGYADFAAVPVAAAAEYAGEDAWVTRRVHAALEERMSVGGRRVYEELDLPLMPVLARMERVGMKIDAAELARCAEAMREEMRGLEARAHELAGGGFNLNSPRQLEEILFDRMGAAPQKKTKKGARSTNEWTLERLAPDFPLAATLLRHRTLAKLVGTYAEKLPLQVLADTGRVHTSFSQTAVMTGRLSSSSPNLQNIPIRTEEGRRIRRAFVADEGFCLVSADYSQVELRVMAHIAQDEALLAAFAAGADIHRQTAAEVFGTAAEEVTGEQRRAAKAINFGLIYGMSAFGLARAMAVPQAQAQVYIDQYFARYPGVAEFMARTRREAPEAGFVETIFGRRIGLGEVRGGRAAVERVAINAPIQGSAADVMKRAMLAVDDAARRGEVPGRMVLQVHDELLVEVASADAEEAAAKVRALMAGAADLSVALEVEAKVGESWGG